MQTRDFLPWTCGVWTLRVNSSFHQTEFPRPARGSAGHPVTGLGPEKPEAPLSLPSVLGLKGRLWDLIQIP